MKLMRKGLLTILLIMLLSEVLHAQEVERLQRIIATEKNDSLRSDAYTKICFELAVDKADDAIKMGLLGLEIAKRLNNKTLQQRAFNSLAQCFDTKQNYAQSFIYFQQALAANHYIGDTLFLSSIYNSLGISYYFQGLLDSSLAYHLKALKIRKMLHSTSDMARSLNNIGLIYRVKRDYTKAINYYNQSLVLKKELGDKKGITVTLTNIGSLYKTLKKYDSAIFFYQQLYDTALKYKSATGIITAQCTIGLCLNSQQKYSASLPLFQEVYNNPAAKEIGDVYPYVLIGMGEALVGSKYYKEAIPYLLKALEMNFSTDRFENKAAVHQILSEAFEKLGNYQKAMIHLRAFNRYNDSTLNEINIRSMNELGTRYQTVEKEQQIKILNKENQVQALLLAENKRGRLILILIIVLVSVTAISIFQRYKNKQKAERMLEEKNNIISKSLEEKEILLKEIHHRVKNNLQVVSSLLNLQSRNMKDVQAQSAIREGRDRVKSMSLIHQNLYQENNLTGVDMKNYIEELADSLFNSYNINKEKVVLHTEIDSIQLDIDNVIPLGLILNELISNALKYAFQENNGVISITLKKTKDCFILKVNDNGAGLPDNFNIEKLGSLGFQLIRSFVLKMKATLFIESKNGTSITINIPAIKMATV